MADAYELWDDEEYEPFDEDGALAGAGEPSIDDPFDTVDFPTLRNMPPEMNRSGMYTPERMGSAENAIRSLLDHNPARRAVLMSIVGWCADGCLTSELSRRVDELQQDNRSVYSPMTLCRMLERAGALVLELPEVSTKQEDPAHGVEYLEIKERIDPVWRSTPAGLSVRDELAQGLAFRDLVLEREKAYREVYRAVMGALDEAPRAKSYIDELVDAFPIVQHPRRFGGHFIDLLEYTDAIEWKGHAWHLTDLGREMLPAVRQDKED